MTVSAYLRAPPRDAVRGALAAVWGARVELAAAAGAPVSVALQDGAPFVASVVCVAVILERWSGG